MSKYDSPAANADGFDGAPSHGHGCGAAHKTRERVLNPTQEGRHGLYIMKGSMSSICGMAPIYEWEHVFYLSQMCADKRVAFVGRHAIPGARAGGVESTCAYAWICPSCARKSASCKHVHMRTARVSVSDLVHRAE